MDIFKNIFGAAKKKKAPAVHYIDTLWRIKIIAGFDSGKIIPLEYSYVKIGRNTGGADNRPFNIRLDDQTVSSNQCHLEWNPGWNTFSIVHDRVPVVNRTFINGRPIDPGVQVALNEGDQVRMGNIVFVVEKKPKVILVREAEPDEPKTTGKLLSPEMATSGEKMIRTGYTLKVIQESEIVQNFPICRMEVVIGRGTIPQNPAGHHLYISDEHVSSIHAKLNWDVEKNALMLTHSLNATNPTTIIRNDDAKEIVFDLIADTPEILQNDDIIMMGETYIYVSLETMGRKVEKFEGMEEIPEEPREPAVKMTPQLELEPLVLHVRKRTKKLEMFGEAPDESQVESPIEAPAEK